MSSVPSRTLNWSKSNVLLWFGANPAISVNAKTATLISYRVDNDIHCGLLCSWLAVILLGAGRRIHPTTSPQQRKNRPWTRVKGINLQWPDWLRHYCSRSSIASPFNNWPFSVWAWRPFRDTVVHSGSGSCTDYLSYDSQMKSTGWDSQCEQLICISTLKHRPFG